MNETASAGRPYEPADAASVFGGRYLSITSYKRDGRGVATRTKPAILGITPS